MRLHPVPGTAVQPANLEHCLDGRLGKSQGLVISGEHPLGPCGRIDRIHVTNKHILPVAFKLNLLTGVLVHEYHRVVVIVVDTDDVKVLLEVGIRDDVGNRIRAIRHLRELVKRWAEAPKTLNVDTTFVVSDTTNGIRNKLSTVRGQQPFVFDQASPSCRIIYQARGVEDGLRCE